MKKFQQEEKHMKGNVHETVGVAIRLMTVMATLVATIIVVCTGVIAATIVSASNHK